LSPPVTFELINRLNGSFLRGDPNFASFNYIHNKSAWRGTLLSARDNLTFARFKLFTAGSLRMAVFWVVVSCSLVEFYRYFRGPCCLNHQGDNGGSIALMMDSARTSEMSKLLPH
jgi:hypothetical protein